MASSSLSLSFQSVAMAKGKFSTSISCKASCSDLTKKKANNFYRVLSIDSETATTEDIKRAYRSLARRRHPDVWPEPEKEESTRMFVELRQAYETLSNPVSRRLYDSELRMNGAQGGGERRWEAQLHELHERSERKAKEKVGFAWTR